jgi:hypothetical protein
MNSSSLRVSLFCVLLIFLPACGGFHSPVIDVLGSYFPAWMVCIVTGLALTLIARLLLIALKLNAGLHPAGIVYPCLMLIFTMAVWLLFYKN